MTANASAPAQPPTTATAGRPVKLEFGGPARAAALMFLGQIGIGAMLGLIAYFVFAFAGMYVPVLTPVLIGAGLGVFAHEIAAKRGFDSLILTAVALLVGGAVAMAAFHVGRYQDFLADIDERVTTELRNEPDMAALSQDEIAARRQTLRQNLLVSSEFFEVGGTSFFDYVSFQVQHGVVIKKTAEGKYQGLPLIPAASAAFFLGEPLLAMIAGLFVAMPLFRTPRSRRTGNRLTETRTMGHLDPAARHDVENLFASGKAGELADDKILSAGKSPIIEVQVRTSKTAGGTEAGSEAASKANADAGAEPEIVLELHWVTKTEKGDERHRRIGRWWYPAEVVSVLDSKFAKHNHGYHRAKPAAESEVSANA